MIRGFGFLAGVVEGEGGFGLLAGVVGEASGLGLLVMSLEKEAVFGC